MLLNMQNSGNGHLPDHCVEFAQCADQVMVWPMGWFDKRRYCPRSIFAERNLDSREYLQIILYHVIQRDFRTYNINRHVMWWQQDGAPCHTSNAAMHYLRAQFPGKLMRKRSDCDFFLWGYFKQQIRNVPHELHCSSQ